jgi:hypothetical protein
LIERFIREGVLIGQDSFGTPLGTLTTGLTHDPCSERDDQPALLGQSNELARGQQAPGRMVPPDQRLQTDHGEGVEVDERLVVHLELIAFEGPVQLVGGAQAAHRLEVVVLTGDGDPRGTALLGPVHGHVGLSQQLRRPGGLGGGE